MMIKLWAGVVAGALALVGFLEVCWHSEVAQPAPGRGERFQRPEQHLPRCLLLTCNNNQPSRPSWCEFRYTTPLWQRAWRPVPSCTAS